MPRLCLPLVVATGMLGQTAAPDATAQKRIIDEVTAKALDYNKTLPNFVCTQVTRRRIDPTGDGRHWKQIDTFDEELSYFDHSEHYKVVSVNGKGARNSDHNRRGGLTSNGEFGSIHSWIFDAKAQTEFHWNAWGSMEGNPVHAIGYHVEQGHSKFTIIRSKSERIVAGYHGLVFADGESKAVLRLTAIAEIPASFPTQDVTLDLIYSFSKIAGQEYLLPIKSDMRLRMGKTLIWNEVTFQEYRKFGAEASIAFDDPDEPAMKKKP
jgi:hypothetical protein